MNKLRRESKRITDVELLELIVKNKKISDRLASDLEIDTCGECEPGEFLRSIAGELASSLRVENAQAWLDRVKKREGFK